MDTPLRYFSRVIVEPGHKQEVGNLDTGPGDCPPTATIGRAVGKYHSPDAERGRRYAWRVYRYYASRSEPGSPTGKERFHAEQKTGAQNLSDARREYDVVLASARKAGLSLSTFSKRVCLGFSVPSLEHQEARLELRRLKGELARLGGLIKQALASGADREHGSPAFT